MYLNTERKIIRLAFRPFKWSWNGTRVIFLAALGLQTIFVHSIFHGQFDLLEFITYCWRATVIFVQCIGSSSMIFSHLTRMLFNLNSISSYFCESFKIDRTTSVKAYFHSTVEHLSRLLVLTDEVTLVNCSGAFHWSSSNN